MEGQGKGMPERAAAEAGAACDRPADATLRSGGVVVTGRALIW